MLEQALKCGERSIKMRQVQRESPKRSISKPQGRAEKSPVENTEEPNYKSWSGWLYDQFSNVRSVHPRKKCFECYSCLLFLAFELLFSFIRFLKVQYYTLIFGIKRFPLLWRSWFKLYTHDHPQARLSTYETKMVARRVGARSRRSYGKRAEEIFEKQIAILSSYQGSRFDPVNQSIGAPNVNFWKIRVRKAIWDLEFSEHLF